MKRAWIALAATLILALLTLSPYDAAPLLALDFATDRTEPAWVAIPAQTRIFSAYEDATPYKAARSGRLDLFSNLPLPTLRAFYESDLAAKGFTVTSEDIPNISPAAAEMLGATGRLRATRPTDHTAMIVSFASQEGLIRQSRLFNIVWRIGTR